MRGVLPAERAHRLIDEAEFELDSIKELMAHSKSLERKGMPKPPPLPLMPLSPPVAAARAPVAAARAPEAPAELPETLAGRLAIVEAS
jgi:hypothetical protein